MYACAVDKGDDYIMANDKSTLFSLRPATRRLRLESMLVTEVPLQAGGE